MCAQRECAQPASGYVLTCRLWIVRVSTLDHLRELEMYKRVHRVR